jgi:hypothetical protein
MNSFAMSIGGRFETRQRLAASNGSVYKLCDETAVKSPNPGVERTARE